MFCPFCGLKTEDSNQKFCTNCGSKLPTVSRPYQLKSVGNQYASTIMSQQTSTIINVPVITQKEKGPPGPYSKRCLICAIMSLVFANIPSMIWHVPLSLIIIGLIITLIIYSVGLILGILSRIYSKKAGKLEPKNVPEKAGSVIAIVGIVYNIISMVSTIIYTIFIILFTGNYFLPYF